MGDAPQGVTRRVRARRIGRGVLKSRRGRVALCLVLILVISLVVLLLSRDPKDPVITLQAGQWDSAELHTGLAEYLIEHGYEQAVETVDLTRAEVLLNVKAWRPDVVMETWVANWGGVYKRGIEYGLIEDLGPLFEGARQVWVVPEWVARAHGITSVDDMASHRDLFPDPRDPSKGVFINCAVGWQCADINETKLDVYGLSSYYNVVTPSSDEALSAFFCEAQESGRPVFGYLWTPHPLMGAYDWHILDEPLYDEVVWAEVISSAADDEAPLPSAVCAYPLMPVHKVARKGFSRRCPEVGRMLSRMETDVESVNETLAWAETRGLDHGSEAAIVHYLEANGDRWTQWVSPRARGMIIAAMEDAHHALAGEAGDSTSGAE